LPALWLPDCLRLPPPERCAALALQSLPQGFQRYLRDAVCLPQDATAGLPDGRRDLLHEVKGKSMLALSRDLGTQYKTAFVLAHKIREAMAAESRGAHVGGAGRKAEVDGGYFGGYVKPANFRENRRDRRLRMNQTGKRKVVVVIRERGGKTLPGVFRNEGDALTFIRTRVAPQTELYADEAGSWNELAARFTLHRINHQEAYSLRDDVQTHTNNAEGFFSRMRRGEIGHHHHVAGPYLIRFAQEAAWREDHRREPNGGQVDRLVALAMANRPSVDFCGYWQRARIG
jgi:ISXO2-like transposase domain